MPRIAVLVSNDLEFDQRVAKVCEWLTSNGYDITLIGRMLPGSRSFSRPYPIIRFHLWASRGALFYAALNIRMLIYLLFHRTDVILANDLDTLLPAFLVSRLRGKKLVYDSHEYFTEAEGLTGRSFQKKVWLSIERFIFPKLRHAYTVNESIAGFYREKYAVDVQVVRNVPILRPAKSGRSKSELGLPDNKHILILQGAYIDPDRGGMELVEAMQFLDECYLLIIGSGRDIPAIDARIAELNLSDRIMRFPRLPFDQLQEYTACAEIGFSLDKPVHLNYLYSLPNKLFDYVHAGLPVLVSDLPELRRVVEEYNLGMITPQVSSESISTSVRTMLSSGNMALWKSNSIAASKVLNWQMESQTLDRIYGASSGLGLLS